MTSRRRALRGFLIAPLAALVVGWLFVLTFDTFKGASQAPIFMFIAVMVYGAPVAYAVAAVIGIPAYLIIRKFTTLRAWHVMTVATAAGVLIGLPGLFGQSLRRGAGWFILATLMGVVAGATFWAVWSDERSPRV